MRRWWFIFAAVFFALPLCAPAATPPQPQSAPIPQSVEEPESVPEPDEEDSSEFEQPEKEVPKPTKEKTKKEKPVKPSESGEAGDEVVLQGLNKVTARASAIEAPIGSVVRFGTIEIIAHSCWKSAPEDRPENAALLEISEVKQGEPPARIFLGWMFSSSPGLSSLEHPFYDVTVVECKKEAHK